jgi:hypothetical protein
MLLHASTLTIESAADPSDAERRAEIGRIQVQYGSVDEGMAWLLSALDYDPHLASAHSALAAYYEELARTQPEYAQKAREHKAQAADGDNRH